MRFEDNSKLSDVLAIRLAENECASEILCLLARTSYLLVNKRLVYKASQDRGNGVSLLYHVPHEEQSGGRSKSLHQTLSEAVNQDHVGVAGFLLP
nr:hypothetical protein CFP56_24656 [Quercus suber]